MALPRILGHCPSSALISDYKACHNYSQEARNVEPLRQRIAAHDRGDREQHLDMVVIDATQQGVRSEAQHQAKRDSATRLLKEQQDDVGHVGGNGGAQQRKGEGKENNTNPVVEEGLPRDYHGDVLRRAGGFQDRENRNWIGGEISVPNTRQ
jgi:hypothetical protein